MFQAAGRSLMHVIAGVASESPPHPGADRQRRAVRGPDCRSTGKPMSPGRCVGGQRRHRRPRVWSICVIPHWTPRTCCTRSASRSTAPSNDPRLPMAVTSKTADRARPRWRPAASALPGIHQVAICCVRPRWRPAVPLMSALKDRTTRLAPGRFFLRAGSRSESGRPADEPVVDAQRRD